MLGKDFFIYWQIGRAALAGLNPYSVAESLYPPAAVSLFMLLALPPFTVAFAMWTGICTAMFVHSLRHLASERMRLLWFLFPPTLFILLTGQIDIFLLWTSTFLIRGGYQAAVSVAIITLKPQVAFIVLPWYLLRWLYTDRRTLVRAIVVTAIVHLLPIIIDPSLYSNWLLSVGSQSAWRLQASPGLFSLTTFGVEWFLIAPIAIAVSIWGLMRSRQASCSAQLLALPMGLWYEGVFLTGVAPVALLLPAGWISFVAAAFLRNSWPLAVMPLIAFVWVFYQERRSSGALTGNTIHPTSS